MLTPVPDVTRTPRLPDEFRKWVSIGAQWRINDSAIIDAGYAHLFTPDATLAQNAESTPAYGFLAGLQETSTNLLGVQFTMSF